VKFIEWVQVIGAAIVVLGFILAVAQVLLTQINERRRSQPIVICHQIRGRTSREGHWVVNVAITNDGLGNAFNVRFGVTLGGVRYPFRMDAGDPFTGNRHRVVRQGQRLPKRAGVNVLIPSLHLYGSASGSTSIDDGEVYWARYENAQGKMWETVNPPDRSSDLQIKRVRFPRLRERHEQKKLAQAKGDGIAWEKKALEEFAAVQEHGEAEARDGDDLSGAQPDRAPDTP
jgi:hypothetical protein